MGKDIKEEVSSFSFNLLEDPKDQFDLYNIAPKTVWGDQPSEGDKDYRRPIERNFCFEEEEYSVVVRPAYIDADEQSANRRDIILLPGEQEEVVEEAIRLLAMDAQGTFIKGRFSVYFTLQQIQDVLEEAGKRQSIKDIEKSVMILARSHITIERLSSSKQLSSGFFMILSSVGCEDWLENKDDSIYAVSCSIFIDGVVRSGKYRRYNSIKSIQYTSLARWMYKRLFREFRDADNTRRYEIDLSTIIRDSSLSQDQPVEKSLEEVRGAMEELKTGRDIAVWEEVETLKSEGEVFDVRFRILVSIELIRDEVVSEKNKYYPEKTAYIRELAHKFHELHSFF